MRAEWCELVALNFHCDHLVLNPLLPPGLELDHYNDDMFLTIVAAKLRDVYLWKLPFAIGHEVDLVSLRFYVRRSEKGIVKERGVVHIKSFVSSRLASWTMRRALKTPFEYAPFTIENTGFVVQGAKEEAPVVDYRWRADGEQNRIRVKARHRSNKLGDDSIFGYLLHRNYWYAANGGKTLTYSVNMAQWKLWDAAQASFTCDARSLFGSQFSKYITRRPATVFICERSPIEVFRE